MKRMAQVEIEGTEALLLNAFREEALDKKKSKSGSTGNNPDEWKTTVVMDENRNIYLPAPYLFAPIKGAGRYTKIGRGNIIAHIAATLKVSPDKILLDGLFVPPEDQIDRDPTKPVYLDVRSVVNPMTKGRNLRYRVACKSGWKCKFFVSWDDNILSTSQMETILKDAGIMCGTGCGRAIGFGRFQLNSFKMCS